MWRFLYQVLCGFFLGLSALAPGISGSIVAIMMGIYHDLLQIISNPLKKLKENFFFCLPLGVGIIFSVIAFVIVFSFLFEEYEKATYMLFVGLIVGNLPVVYNATKSYGLRKLNIICGSVAMIAAFTLAVLAINGGHSQDDSILTVSYPLIIISGLTAGASLLIPGMSFSVILILMGVYGHLIEISKSLLQGNIDYLMPIGIFMLNIVIGLMLASRAIKAAFDKYPAFANTVVLGFIAGSLVGMAVQSLRMDDPGFVWWHGALTLTAGLGLSILFTYLSRKRKGDNYAGVQSRQ